MKNADARVVISFSSTVAGNPKIAQIPNQTGMMAICAVAASPINSRLPTSSIFANPAAMPTAREIKKLTIRGLNSLYLTGGSVNDGFLAGVLGGFRRYHERLGVDVSEVDTLPVGLPISLRTVSSTLSSAYSELSRK